MELGKLFVIVEWKVQMAALQIRPSMSATIEDLIVYLIHIIAVVGPEFGFGQRIHEGVSSSGQKHGVPCFQDRIDAKNIVGKGAFQCAEIGFRMGGLKFDYVQYQFI